MLIATTLALVPLAPQVVPRQYDPPEVRLPDQRVLDDLDERTRELLEKAMEEALHRRSEIRITPPLRVGPPPLDADEIREMLEKALEEFRGRADGGSPGIVWPQDGMQIIPPLRFEPPPIPAPDIPELPSVFDLPELFAPAPIPPYRAVRFLGRIEGSDRIEITPEGARWVNVAWGTHAGSVLLGDRAWNPAADPFLANDPNAPWLPPDVDLGSAELVRIHGRDQVVLERAAGRLVVQVSDTAPGSDLYEFELRFPLAGAAFELEIVAPIDGSDTLRIDAEGFTWAHHFYGWPTGPVLLNGQPWQPSEDAPHFAGGREPILPPGLDFGSARVLSKGGRDLISVEAREDHVLVRFADNPNGSSEYRVRIGFDVAPAAARTALPPLILDW